MKPAQNAGCVLRPASRRCLGPSRLALCTRPKPTCGGVMARALGAGLPAGRDPRRPRGRRRRDRADRCRGLGDRRLDRGPVARAGDRARRRPVGRRHAERGAAAARAAAAGPDRKCQRRTLARCPCHPSAAPPPGSGSRISDLGDRGLRHRARRSKTGHPEGPRERVSRRGFPVDFSHGGGETTCSGTALSSAPTRRNPARRRLIRARLSWAEERRLSCRAAHGAGGGGCGSR